jgi:hypothetical protein
VQALKNVVRLLTILVPFLAFAPQVGAQSQPNRARIALFEPAAPKADPSLKAILATVADTVELSLTCLDTYEIKRLPAIDPSRDLGKIRAYCKENRIDQAIGGTASARKGGGYTFRLVVYYHRTDKITVDREGASKGALDIFEVTDALVASLLEGLSGTHLLFGSLAVETDPPGATVSVNGRDVGAAPVALRGLPVGSLRIAARFEGREQAETSVAITDGEETSASLTLERSTGTWAAAIPEDATVTFRSAEIGEQVIEGPEAEVKLPTGSYDVQATCPGLAPASTRIAIRRGETSRWMPWPKGYLAVESDPPETNIFVDDEDKGLSPTIVQVEPGSLHKIELRREKYQAYRTDVNVSAGTKTPVSVVLTPRPGSIRVETNLKGANVRVAGAGWKNTPCTFSDLAPGPHEVTISPFLLARRFYACEGTFTVDVQPDETTTLSKSLVPGMATLQITDAPPGSTVSVDGSPLDPAKVLTSSGAEIPAGIMNLEVTSLFQQKWQKEVSIGNGVVGRWKVGDLVASLPRWTMKIDGKSDDWRGVWPQWTAPARSDIFPNQSGTQLTKVSVCRDDKFLYGRAEFADGTPTMKVSKDIKSRLVYQLQVTMPNNDLLIMEMDSDRQNGTWRWVGVWNTANSLGTTLEQDFSYRAADSMLEFAVPLTNIKKYLAGGPYNTQFYVANADENGQWLSNVGSGMTMIDFAN